MSKPLTIKRSASTETDPLPPSEGPVDAPSATDLILPVDVETPPAPTSSEAPAAEIYGKGGVYRSIGGGRRVKK